MIMRKVRENKIIEKMGRKNETNANRKADNKTPGYNMILTSTENDSSSS